MEYNCSCVIGTYWLMSDITGAKQDGSSSHGHTISCTLFFKNFFALGAPQRCSTTVEITPCPHPSSSLCTSTGTLQGRKALLMALTTTGSTATTLAYEPLSQLGAWASQTFRLLSWDWGNGEEAHLFFYSPFTQNCLHRVCWQCA